ncbi:Kinase [Hexamita inflata]|uniref:Kinase n=1 Tax=Hexamita inflata TaxID=28002 RepID=A0AA86RN25_9EUKA|nr:Kinase [Hexamita inflata]
MSSKDSIFKTVNDFKKIKLCETLDKKPMVYEYREAENRETGEKLTILTLLQSQDQIIQKLMQLKSQTAMLPSEVYKIENTYHLVFPRKHDPVTPERMKDVPECIIWEWITSIGQLLHEFKQIGLLLNAINPHLVQLEKHTNFLHFFSFCEVTVGQSQADFDKDMSLLGQFIRSIFPDYPSVPICHLTHSLTSASPKITVEELYDHPVVKPFEFKRSVAAQTTFKLSDFKFSRELGSGAYGRCDLVTYLPSMEQVVLKSTTNSKAQDIEVTVLQAVAHPNVVRFYGAYTDARTHYIVMQFCEGGDLFDRLTKGSLPQTNVVIEWLSQLCSAIYFMHSLKMIHRDIKPQNVLIYRGQAMLADFGVSREVEEYAQTVVGTPLYFSPEQHYRQQYTIAADIFALGLVFFNMCVGSHPFTSQPADAQQFYSYVKKHGNANAYCNYIKDPSLKQLISSMLIFDPKKRATAEDLCKHPVVFKYLQEHGLFGPGLPSMLTSPRIITVGMETTPVIQGIIQAKQIVLDKIRKNKDECGVFFNLSYELVPFLLLHELRKIYQDKNLYYEYVVKQEAQDIQEKLKTQLQLPDFHPVQNLQSQNNVVRTDNQVVQVSSILTSLQTASGASINLAPALHLTDNIQIKSKIVVIVCQHAIVERPVTLTVDADICVIGFQKHGGVPLTVNIGNGQMYVDKNVMKNINVNKEAKIADFAELTKSNSQLNKIVGLLNVCFPHQFAGQKGFYVGGAGWE